jgi:heme-degrading monooxygenase HmoA
MKGKEGCYVCRIFHDEVRARDAVGGGALADQFAPAFKAAKGFKGVTFLADFAAGEYGLLSLWESKEDYEAFGRAVEPQLQQALAGIVKEPPVKKDCDVYEPKV